MIRKLTLTVSIVVMIVATNSAGALDMEPPRWEDCKDWELRQAGVGNWVNAPRDSYWVCTSGDSKGRIDPVAGVVGSSSSSGGGDGGGGDTITPPETTKQKGNNGIGNGLDPQPPGDPPINDGPDKF